MRVLWSWYRSMWSVPRRCSEASSWARIDSGSQSCGRRHGVDHQAPGPSAAEGGTPVGGTLVTLGYTLGPARAVPPSLHVLSAPRAP